ncbi:MAG TPA: adenylyltransferase/cytidyltransferase family protein [Candidatus Paceibacterota bacterium]|jgi:FAD synthetase|nr:adenylyltransferase/cytidyltransferase family protein [Candidatus Paceibacterota bacterium]
MARKVRGIKKIRQVRIMVFGTFDGLHKGHLHFFAQARKLAQKSSMPFLIASIARDKNVKNIKNKISRLKERARMSLVKKSSLIDKVILSGIKNHIPHIVKEKPDIIALGYDQSAYTKNLKKDLQNKGIFVKIVRLKPYKIKFYNNHLLRKKR